MTFQILAEKRLSAVMPKESTIVDFLVGGQNKCACSGGNRRAMKKMVPKVDWGWCDLSVALAPREMVFSVKEVENHRHHHAEPLHADCCNKSA